MVASPGRVYKADKWGNVDAQPWTDQKLGWIVSNSTGTTVDVLSNSGRIKRTGTALGGYADYGVAVLDVRAIGPNYEMYIEYAMNTTSEQYMAIGFSRDLPNSSGQGDAPNDGLFVETSPADGGSNTLWLQSAATTFSNLVTINPHVWVAGSWYGLRIRRDGAFVRVRSWPLVNAEPLGVWHIDTKTYLHYQASGRNYVSIGGLGGSAGVLDSLWDNFEIRPLTGHDFNSRRRYWIPAGGGNNWVEDVVCTVSATTSGTDLLAMTESVTTTGSGTTSGTDTLAMQESVICTAVVTNPGTDQMSANENPVVLVAGTTDGSDTMAVNEDVTCSVSATTSSTDSLAATEPVQCDINGTTSGTDVLGYNEIVTCNVSATTSSTDSLAATEDVTCTVVGTTAETDLMAANENQQCDVIGTTSGSDSLGALENLQCNVVGTTSATDLLAMLENPIVTVVGTTTGLDTMAMVEADLLCLINATTEGTDILNGEEPSIPVIVYAAAPWKVSGFR